MKNEAAPGASLNDIPIPSYTSNEVLIRVKHATICGTDLHIYNWDKWSESRVKTPIVFGHEFSGEIVAVGENVVGWQEGDYVTAETHIVCGICLACRKGQSHVCANTRIIGVDRAGCFAEYIAMPASNLWGVSGSIERSLASLLEPMGNAVHALLISDVATKSVAVMGCGPIGLIAVSVAKSLGVYKVIAIDPNSYRLDLAKKLGADLVLSPVEADILHEVAAATYNLGVDVVLEMSGNIGAIQQAVAMLSLGGRISMLGLPNEKVELDVTNDIIFKGITMHGIVGRKMYETWLQTSRLLEAGIVDLKPLVTHRFDLEEFEHAFGLMQQGNCGKIIFDIGD